jgi:hypothetical protein
LSFRAMEYDSKWRTCCGPSSFLIRKGISIMKLKLRDSCFSSYLHSQIHSRAPLFMKGMNITFPTVWCSANRMSRLAVIIWRVMWRSYGRDFHRKYSCRARQDLNSGERW